MAISVAVAALTLASAAMATWQAAGSGSGYAATKTMPTGNTPSASVSNRKVTVSWSASTLPGGAAVDGYQVKRYSTGGTQQTIGANCSGTIAALSCTENAVPSGSWKYTVTPVLANWRGTESAMSSTVTVASPAFTLNSSTVSCLPTTLTGQITNFIDGQTVTFRLDNPTSGTVLSGSIVPSPVPSSGTASVSVTIPAGTSSGSHTVYAVGSQGDTASAALTVATNGFRVASGSYTGNLTDNRNITGVGFQPDAVIVKGNTAQVAVMRTSTMSGDATKPLSGATALSTSRIKALQSDGFQVGTNAQVNSLSTTYYWTAFKASAGHMTLGSYTGTGVNRSITGLGYSPEYVMVMSAGASNAVQRMSAMTRSFRFDADTGSTTGVTSLDSDGFSLGTDSQVNTNGTAYHYAAFNQCSADMTSFSYTGDGTASKSVTGVGFQPNYLIVHANDTATARAGVHKPTAVSGTGSLNFSAATNLSNGITGLSSDGFLVGNNAATNTTGIAYDYVAFKDDP
ncbi:MAG: DUF7483 domain-containing protein [Solirubrobacterales bacterium]